jgi:hypothetical protein
MNALEAARAQGREAALHAELEALFAAQNTHGTTLATPFGRSVERWRL